MLARSLTRLLPVLLVSLAPFSCRSKSQPASGGPAGSASARPRDAGCRPIGSTASVVLGSESERAPSADDELAEADLPYSVELGDAHAGEEGFLVSAIENRGGANVAVVAHVDATTGAGRVVSLGRIYGDVGAPVVARHGDRWIFAVLNSDASAVTLRLVSLGAPYGESALKRGAEVTSVSREAPAVALAFGKDGGLLVWNTLEKGASRLALAEVDPSGPSLRGEPRVLSLGATEDVESPRLQRRPSGYYLGYLVRAPSKVHKPMGADDAKEGAPEDLIEDGRNALEVVPLDAHGAAVASPIRLSTASNHVAAFDLAPLPDGGVLVVYRDARGPGLDRPSVQAVHVRPDGSSETRAWEVGDSAGIPTLLFDANPLGREQWGWVALPAEGRTLLGAIGKGGLSLGELREEASLKHAEPLAVQRGRLLAAVARGTRRELVVFDCSAIGARG